MSSIDWYVNNNFVFKVIDHTVTCYEWCNFVNFHYNFIYIYIFFFIFFFFTKFIMPGMQNICNVDGAPPYIFTLCQIVIQDTYICLISVTVIFILIVIIYLNTFRFVYICLK